MIWAIAPDGSAKQVVNPGLAKGGDIGVESVAFVPPGFSKGGYVYYADRKSASRYIFVYPLMTPFSDTRERQQSVLDELAAHSPRFIVTVNLDSSFLADDETPTLLHDELSRLIFRDYLLVAITDPDHLHLCPFNGTITADQVLPPPVEHVLAVWQRRDR